MKPIAATKLEQFQDLRQEFYDLEATIIERINDILYSLGSVCGFTFTAWRTADSSNDYASAWILLPNKQAKKNNKYIDTSQIEFIGFYQYKNFNPTIIIEGIELNVLEKIPLRWLHEDFKHELANGKLLVEDKIKTKQRQIDLIKSKLTERELKLLELN